MGVYLICYKRRKIIYVGKTGDLRTRLVSNHLSKASNTSTSIFRRKLTREPFNLKPGKEMLDWIKDNCSFCWIEIEDKDLCHATEAFLIAYLRKRGEPLINS